MYDSLNELEEADLYVLNDKFKSIYQTKQIELSKYVLKNNAMFGICLQRYLLNKYVQEEDYNNRFESINMNMAYQPYLMNTIELLKDVDYVQVKML